MAVQTFGLMALGVCGFVLCMVGHGHEVHGRRTLGLRYLAGGLVAIVVAVAAIGAHVK